MSMRVTRRRSRGTAVAAVAAVAALVVSSGSAPGAGAEQASGSAGVGRTIAGALDSGGNHSCAILGDGGVRCWGRGASGRLGYGSTADVGDDEAVTALGSVYLGAGRTATSISAGDSSTCAIRDDGNVLCWGANDVGQLGRGDVQSIGDNELPGNYPPVALAPGRTARAVSVGYAHACAILDDGSVRCWGYGGAGALGYGNITNIGDDEPPSAAGPVYLGNGRTATAITTGTNTTCAILDDGSVRCWGRGGSGALGYGNTQNIGDGELPGSVGTVFLGAGRTAKAIAAGSEHVCAILDTGDVRCWGIGVAGRLGYGNTDTIGDDETPGSVPVVDISPAPFVNGFGLPAGLGSARPQGLSVFDLDALSITTGASHTCVTTSVGTVSCWGYGASGALGRGTTASIGDNEKPADAGTAVIQAGLSAVSVTAGAQTTCAVLSNGRVKCWGEASFGALGHQSTQDLGDDEALAGAPVVELGGLVVAQLGFAAAPTARATSTGVVVNWVVAATLTAPSGISVTLSNGRSVSLPASASSATFDGIPAGSSISALVELLGPTPVSARAETVVSGTNAFVPLPPQRILDTRSGVGAPPGRVAADSEVALAVLDRAGVPASGVAAIILNVTATDAGGSGFVTAYPAGIARPEASNLNLESVGQTIPNLVTVGLGQGGLVTLYTSVSTHLLADVAGYYTAAPQSQAAGRLVPVDPTRVLDTRSDSGGPIAGGSARELRVTGIGGVPTAGVSALVLNVTATGAEGRGYMTVFPSGSPRPEASNLNFAVGQTVPNQVIVPVGVGGNVSMFASATTHVVVDVAGWFTDSTAYPTWTGLFIPVTPTRTVDTRASGKLDANATVSVPVRGRAGIAASGSDIAAVAMNVTATGATAPGYITAYPTGVERPEASNLNLERAGQTIPNHVVVRVGKDGTVTLSSEAGTHVLADLTGWYLGGEP
jgi:alpha-tubulin suppressor-like RCC1 family protein